MKIKQVEAQYEIPGIEVAANALERDDPDDEAAGSPFALSSAFPSMPSPASWQELLGLAAIAPTAISIDPPGREVVAAKRFRSFAASQGDETVAGPESTSTAARRMLALMAQIRETAERIRSRSREVV